MCQIELSAQEQEILGQVLQHSLATLEVEIQHTDHQEFKELLKHRRNLINGLLARIAQPFTTAG